MAIDPEKIEKTPSRKLSIEDAAVNVGIGSDQTFLSSSYIVLGDNLGDRKVIAQIQSVSSFVNYELTYVDLSKRLQKGITGFYNAYYFIAQNPTNGEIVRTRNPYKFIGGEAFAAYPLNRYYRLEGSVGFLSRKYEGYPVWINTDEGSGQVYIATENNFPTFGGKLVGDTTEYQEFGPISGRRMSLGFSYAPYTGGTKAPGSSGPTLTFDTTLDLRQYVKITERSLLAARLYGFHASGNLPDVLAFGGVDTLRALPVYGLYGNTAGFLNLEFRFPVIDFLITPILGIRDIRGKAFLDVGGAALKNQPFQFWSDYELCGIRGVGVPGCNGSSGGLADYGFGVELNFLGLPLHFDFARQWNVKGNLGPAQCFATNLKDSCGNFTLVFYIGPSF